MFREGKINFPFTIHIKWTFYGTGSQNKRKYDTDIVH